MAADAFLQEMRNGRNEIANAANGFGGTQPPGVLGKAWSDLQASGQAFQDATRAFFEFEEAQFEGMQRDIDQLEQQIDDLEMQRQELEQMKNAREDELMAQCVAALPLAP